jgi:hypothetical protein
MKLRAIALISVLGLVGCGGDSPFEYTPIRGRITYEDGTAIPATGMRLRFDAQDAPPLGEAHARPAKANVDAEGAFPLVTSYKYGDGLIPGKHKVSIDYAVDEKGKLLVPKEYTHPSTTPLVIDTADAPLEIKVPKP